MAILVIFTAFLVRILFNVYVVGIEEPGLGVFPDSKEYDALGWSLASGRGFGIDEVPSTYRAPGYPFFLSIIYVLFGHSYAAVKIIQSLIGSLTCLFVFLIGERLFTKRVGVIAAGVAAVYPYLVVYTGVLLSETLFVFLSMGFLYLLVRLSPAFTWWQAGSAGLLLGAMNLTRPVILLFPIFLFFWGWARFGTKVKAAILTGVVLGSMCLVVLPWTLRNYLVTGSFVLIAAHPIWGALYGANNPTIVQDPDTIGGWVPPDQMEDPRSAYLSFMRHYFLHEPLELLRLELHKLKRFWSVFPKTTYRDRVISLFSYGLLLPLFLTGVVLSLQLPEKPWILLTWILYFNLIALVFYGSTRFRLPVEPVLILFGAFALDRFAVRFRVVRNDPRPTG